MTVPTGKYGDPISPIDVGDRQVAAISTTKAAMPPLQLDRWTRNGMYPSAQFQNMMNEAANQAVLYRTKEVFSTMGPSQQLVLSAGAGDRMRWNFFWHSGPLTHALGCHVIMLPPSSDYTWNTYARIDISTSPTGSPVVFSETFVYGASPTGSTTANGYAYWKPITKMIDGLQPDTDYYARVYDVDSGRIHSATFFDLQSMTETFNGYLSSNITTHSAIVSKYRSDLITLTNTLILKGGAKVMSWSVDNGTVPVVATNSTSKNIIDTTATTVTTATPGWTIDLTGKDRLASGGTVPVVFGACGNCVAFNSGAVYLKDSTGTILATLGSWTPAAAPTWLTTTVNLPATQDKYDICVDDGTGLLGGTPPDFNLFAVGMIEYG